MSEAIAMTARESRVAPGGVARASRTSAMTPAPAAVALTCGAEDRGPHKPRFHAPGDLRPVRETRALMSSTSKRQAARTGLEILEQLGEETRAAVSELLDGSGIHYYDINADSRGAFFMGWNKHQWDALPDEQQPAVKRARDAADRFRHFARAAVSAAAPERGSKLDGIESLLRRVIEQPNGSYPNGAPAPTIDGVKAKLGDALEEALSVIRSLPTAQGGDELLVVSDTSALLDRPDLQSWQLGGEPWTLVALPQVLSELDERKRDPRTRDAAQKVIRQFEEFDRRGNTFDGVPIAGKGQFREVPITADMNRTLPWLRADVPDDVIVAGALELTWSDLSSRVAVVASDRNVRNKARLAGLSVVRTDEL